VPPPSQGALPALEEYDDDDGAAADASADAGANMSDLVNPYGVPAWGYMPYAMFGGYPGHVFPYGHPYGYPMGADAAQAQSQSEGASTPSDWKPPLPALGYGAPLGFLHSFHVETRDMGTVTPDFRTFTKIGYEGRLSVVSESKVHTSGVQRYLVQFTWRSKPG